MREGAGLRSRSYGPTGPSRRLKLSEDFKSAEPRRRAFLFLWPGGASC
jgi:hypothetical protein